MGSVQLILLIIVHTNWRSINPKRVCINASDMKFKMLKIKMIKGEINICKVINSRCCRALLCREICGADCAWPGLFCNRYRRF